MHWSSKYLSLKHQIAGRGPDGVDCWGLVLLIYEREFGIKLPDFPGISKERVGVISDVVETCMRSEWVPCEPFDGAVVGMSQSSAIHHVGICVGNSRTIKILHCWDGANVNVDSSFSLRAKGFRTVKFYRHRQWPT